MVLKPLEKKKTVFFIPTKCCCHARNECWAQKVKLYVGHWAKRSVQKKGEKLEIIDNTRCHMSLVARDQARTQEHRAEQASAVNSGP